MKYSTTLLCKLCLLFLPATGISQTGNKQSVNWSYNYLKRASQIPVIQQAMVDTINKKFDFLSIKSLGGDSLRASFDLYKNEGFKAVNKNLQKLITSQNDAGSLLSNLPILYALKEKANFARIDFPIAVNRLTAQSNYESNYPNRSLPVATYFMADFNIKVGGVPMTYKTGWTYPSFFEQKFQSLNKVSFDHEEFVSGLRNKLSAHFDIDKVLLQNFDFKNLFRDYAQNKVNGVKKSLTEQFADEQSLLSEIKELSVEEFLYLNKQQLQDKLFRKTLFDSLGSLRNQYETLLSSASFSGNRDSLTQQLTFLNGHILNLTKLAGTVGRIKDEFETNGLNYNQLVQYQQTVNQKVDEISRSEQFVKEASNNLLSLPGLSRIFLKIRELNIGQFSNNWSERSISNVLSSGFEGGFLNKKSLLGVNLSKNQIFGWQKDYAFNSSLFEQPASIQAIKFGREDGKNGNSQISAVNAVIKNNTNFITTNFPGSLPSLPRNIFVGSFSKKISMGAIGEVETEVAKSSSQYRNTQTATTDNQLESKMAVRYFGEDFFQTLSLGLRYNGDLKKLALQPKAFFNYSGIGYNNPASSTQGRGSISYGLNVSKSFSKKASLQTRISRRINKVSLDDRKLNQLQFSSTGKYKVSKKLKLGFNWSYSNLVKSNDHIEETLYYSNRINSDISFTGKLGQFRLFQYGAVGYQNISIPSGFNDPNGQMFWVSSMSNLMLSKGAIILNTQFYNPVKESPLQQRLIMSDVGYSFSLLKSINLSTSLNYLSQQSVARQLGMRQTISAQVNRKININAFADLRKNLITNKNSLLYPNTRGEIAISYALNY